MRERGYERGSHSGGGRGSRGGGDNQANGRKWRLGGVGENGTRVVWDRMAPRGYGREWQQGGMGEKNISRDKN